MSLNFTGLSFKDKYYKPAKKLVEKSCAISNTVSIKNKTVNKDYTEAFKAYALSSPAKAMAFKGLDKSTEIKYIPDEIANKTPDKITAEDIDKVMGILSNLEEYGQKRGVDVLPFIFFDFSLKEHPENIKYLNKLLNARNGQLGSITNIFNVLNENNSQYLDTLLNAKQLYGKGIGNILSKINKDKDNGQYLKDILQLKNSRYAPIGAKEIEVCLALGSSYKTLQSKTSINQLSLKEKKGLLRTLVKDNSILFYCDFGKAMTILPRNKGQYCSLMKKLVENIGIDSKPLTDDARKSCFEAMSNLENIIPKANLENTQIMLKYPKNRFIRQVHSILSKLHKKEKAKIKEYFGFEIKDNKLFEYPVNNDKKPVKIGNIKTRQALENLRPYINQFTKENKVIFSPENKALENELNKITRVLPELYTRIDTNNLKTLQKVMKDGRYKSLNEKDRHILQLATLFHNIDKDSADDSAFVTYMMVEKLGIPDSDERKLYSVIKYQNWWKAEDEKDIQDVAYGLRKGNSFELAKILSDSKLKVEEASLDENKMAESANKVEKYIKQIQPTEIVLPQTRIPKASQIKIGSGIEEVEADGIKNKIIYINQIPDLEAAGFDKGTDVTNFYALVHAFDDNGNWGVDGKVVQFMGLKNIENDSLLSTSFIKADDYKVFRHQGFILDVDYDDIGAAYYRDFGSGIQKDLKTLKYEYIFGNERNEERNYISDNLKKALGYSDEQYVDFMNRIQQTRSITDIEKIDPKAADAMQKMFEEMENGKRAYGREYNEVLVLHPKVQGVFAYDEDVKDIPSKLREYAQENDLPIIIFGNPQQNARI